MCGEGPIYSLSPPWACGLFYLGRAALSPKHDGEKAYEAKCREAGLAFLESLKNEFKSYETQEKEATPADTKQLKEDELMLVEFNVENESTRYLAQTPSERYEKIMEAKMRGLESGTCETLFKPMLRRIDYTTQEKEATPADTQQLKEDELMLVKFNIENESTHDLALTPVHHEGKYPGKSENPLQITQADTDLSSKLD
nr:hypothetical protein [Tanacetum cinerariifolium]